jgi:ribosome-binding factor A
MSQELNGPSQRQLRVGETIKRALSETFRTKIYEQFLDDSSIIISEVRMTPDLRFAYVYVFFLFNENIDKKVFLENLNAIIPKVKNILAKQVKLRYLPELKFVLDNSFDEASKINQILSKR